MSETVIRVENLSKKYVIDHAGDKARYESIRESVTNGVKGLARRLLGRGSANRSPTKEEFWALRDVSFEVKRGEVVGVIGRNGAGKSTLLKLLSQITAPTSGRIELDGRVASLLEVGTGFHPELTGRENVYLNGAILGMSRAEIKRKFDEIVAFAEVEKFLDTPVKRYSSGMYMRLAFAVAAHLEPEILIVDEVLAVGDAAFQKKCLGLMGKVSKSGRTVLFVSHNIGSLTAICHTGLLLDRGKVIHRDDIWSVAKRYSSAGDLGPTQLEPNVFRGPLRTISFQQIILNGRPIGARASVDTTSDLQFVVRGRAIEDVPDFKTTFSLFRDGVRIVTMHDTLDPELMPEGVFEVTYTIPSNLLRPGEYSIAVGGRRVAGDDWIWATDLAVVEVIPIWGPNCDRDDHGVINLPGRGIRTVMAPGVVASA